MNISLKEVMLMLVMLFFIPGVYGISLSISGGDAGNSVSSTTKLSAPDAGTINLKATLGSNGGTSLSQSISGNGDLFDSHYVQNTKGHRAEISVGIAGADDYTYAYTLYPGNGYVGSSKYVSAGEDLTVHNADSIDAYAIASTTDGHTARADFAAGFGASVDHYSNYAEASDGHAIASQKTGFLTAPYVLIIESSHSVNSESNHQLNGGFALNGYSARADATNGGTSVAADYSNLNAYSAIDQAFGEYRDPLKGLDCLSIHQLLGNGFTLSSYSVKADATKSGTNVAADYAQFVGNNVDPYSGYAQETANGHYQNSFKGIDYLSSTGYYGTIKLDSYTVKASTKGTTTSAISTLTLPADAPLNQNYFAEVWPIYARSIFIDNPGKYSAVAEFDGKKLNVNVAPVT